MTLSQIQFELKAPKSQYNSFGRYHYRSNEDILSAVKPLLAKYGDQLVLTDEPVPVGDWHYIKATAIFKAKDGTETRSTGYAREPASKKGMDDSQITGTASSYARKYALNGLFLIDDTKDADTNEYQQQQKQSRRRQPQRKTPAKPKPSQLELDRKEYAELRAKIIKASGNKFSPADMNKSLAQMANISPKDNQSTKASKMVEAAREALKQYQGGKKQ